MFAHDTVRILTQLRTIRLLLGRLTDDVGDQASMEKTFPDREAMEKHHDRLIELTEELHQFTRWYDAHAIQKGA